MLNFWKVPPLAPHPAHLAVQIFAVLKPVVSESKVLECNKNIKDLGGFYLHTNSCGLQEGIKAAWVCIIDSKINELENKEEATSGMTFIKCGLSLLWIISVWSHQGASLKSSSVVEAHTHMYLITSLPTHTHTFFYAASPSLEVLCHGATVTLTGAKVVLQQEPSLRMYGGCVCARGCMTVCTVITREDKSC